MQIVLIIQSFAKVLNILYITKLFENLSFEKLYIMNLAH